MSPKAHVLTEVIAALFGLIRRVVHLAVNLCQVAALGLENIQGAGRTFVQIAA